MEQTGPHAARVYRLVSEKEQLMLTGEVQPRTGLTPYVRFGNWPVLAVLWVGLAVIAVSCRRSIRR